MILRCNDTVIELQPSFYNITNLNMTPLKLFVIFS